MYCEAHPLLQLVTALAVLVATAFVARAIRLPLSLKDVPMSRPRFWFSMLAFAGPVGAAMQVLYCDGLLLQLAGLMLVAGVGLWLGERLLGRGPE